jgi:hypothetical protein
MMRNLESRATHWLNARYSLQGRLWERSYKSFPRGDAAQVLKSITYTVMNPVKHGAVKRAEDYEFNDADVYFFGKATGIVTPVPAMWSALGRTPEERAKRIKELMDEVWAEGVRCGDLLKAAHRAIERRPSLRDGRRWAETVPVGAWIGHEAAEKQRKEVLDFVAPRTEFQPRRAPSMGEVIEIRIKQAAPRPLAGASWREWHT